MGQVVYFNILSNNTILNKNNNTILNNSIILNNNTLCKDLKIGLRVVGPYVGYPGPKHWDTLTLEKGCSKSEFIIQLSLLSLELRTSGSLPFLCLLSEIPLHWTITFLNRSYQSDRGVKGFFVLTQFVFWSSTSELFLFIPLLFELRTCN